MKAQKINTKTLLIVFSFILLLPLFLRPLLLKRRTNTIKCEVRAAWIRKNFYKNSKKRYLILKKIYHAKLNTLFIKVPHFNPYKKNYSKKEKQFIAFLKHARKLKISLHGWIASRHRKKGRLSDFRDERERRAQALWVLNILKRYPLLDGIHLDYIRYEKTPFKIDLEKTNAVTKTVALISRKVKNTFPQKKISVAVWNISRHGKLSGKSFKNNKTNIAFHREYQQNPIAWLKEGLIDAIIPMNYTKDNSYWNFELMQWKKRLGKNFNRIYMGLGWLKEKGKPDWGYDAKGIIEKIYFGRKKGLKGFSIFLIRDHFDPNKIGKDFDRQLILLLGKRSVNKTKAPFKKWVSSCLKEERP